MGLYVSFRSLLLIVTCFLGNNFLKLFVAIIKKVIIIIINSILQAFMRAGYTCYLIKRLPKI